MPVTHNIEEKLRLWKRRCFLQSLLRGLFYWLSLSGAVLLVVAFLESQFWFSSWGRTLLYFTLLSVSASSGVVWVLFRLWRLCYYQRLLSDETAARSIGEQLPNVEDKLLNYVQLRSHAAKSQLAQAGLARRTISLGGILFTEILPWRKSARFLRYFLPVCATFLLIWWVDPKFITQSTERVYHYERAYAMPLPFRFVLGESALVAFVDEPYELPLQIKGTYVPEKVYIVAAGRYIRMQERGEGQFLHRFESVHKDISFYFEADGYRSAPYVVRVLERPTLLEARLQLRFPPYTGLPSETLRQLRNMELPEGSWVRWRFQAKATDSISLRFGRDERVRMAEAAGVFSTERRFLKASSYSIHLKNRHSTNKDSLQYSISLRKDEFPRLYPRVFSDTVFYRLVVVAGAATDDYGISAVRLQYRRQREGRSTGEGQLALPFRRQNRRRAVFYLQWPLDSLGLVEGEVLSYRIQAWDNDGIRGAKAAYSSWYRLRMPDSKGAQEQIIEEGERSSSSMQQSQAESKELQEQIKSLQDRIKLKKRLDWRDKKQLKELIEQRETIDQKIQELKKQQGRFEEKVKRFDAPSEEMREKMDQLRQLIEEVLDPETKKLYEELRQLMEKGAHLPQVQDMLSKLSQKEELQSKNLERAISLMKRLQYDLHAKQLEEQLKSLAEAQQALRKRTKTGGAGTETLVEEQQRLQEDFRRIEKSLDRLQDMQNEIDMPLPQLEFQEDRKQVRAQQKASEQRLLQQQRKDARKAQQSVERLLEHMRKKIATARSQAAAQQVEVDVALMQKLLDNLIMLSLQQEALEVSMSKGEELSHVQQDEIAQQQFDIQEASLATLDSLSAFAQRNFQISSKLYEGIQSLEMQLEESLEAMRERRSSKARTQQRYAMASFNKLALFVSELLDKLEVGQQAGLGGGNQPSLTELQKQLLKQIQELKKSDKKGEQMSEELARMIAEQEAIRRRLEEFSRSREGMLSGKKELEQLLKKMKEMERRLAHKDLSENLIKEQRKITTRLLDFERAEKEDKEDKKRKSKQAGLYDQTLPPELKPYIPDRKGNLMQLKWQPLPLNTYYEEEVRKYLQRLQNIREAQAPL